MNNSSQKLNVHFMPGDGAGWALDEDQRQMRQALRGIVRETSVAKAEILHTPFWQGLGAIAPKILKQKFVIAHADNPPFFYLKQPDFAWGQQVVNLWIARSQEALEQFRALKLPVEYIPYTIDPELFFPVDDKKGLRKKFGIPEHAYVIANFHRDSEGDDLNTPKIQKAPELFLAILKELKQRGHSFHVLLAGPRRHWLRKVLAQEGMSFTFVGKQNVVGDDFGINILKRQKLNELINAADLYLIPSRWEGGPQSVMEAAASRCKILSTPLGVAKDILESISLFRTVDEAVEKIVQDQETHFLQSTVQPQWEKWNRFHTTATLQEELKKLYERLPERLPQNLSLTSTDSVNKSVAPVLTSSSTNYTLSRCAPSTPSSSLASTTLKAGSQREDKLSTMSQYRQQAFHVLKRWARRLGVASHIRSVGWYHEMGKDSDLDNILLNVSNMLRDEKIKQHPAQGRGIEIIGYPSEQLPPAKKGVQRLQWIVPQMGKEHFLPEALLIAPSVQDVLNLRVAGCFQPAIVLPWPVASVALKTSFSEPLMVAKGDRFASLDIWKAMSAGRPIVYPRDSAYYEQVFHAGLSFQSEEELPQMIQKARTKIDEFRLLAKIPTRKKAQQHFKQLLSILKK
ncbi:MAG: glycosyltransferase family 4 protein [Verrucomicrobia bacterium]|nr:glycosyltransferase family 4 protein [Verrucomicrobiota bacterium]